METSFSYHPSSFADHFDGSSIFSSIGMMEKGDTEGISSCYPSLYSPFADLAVDHTQVNECSYNQPVMNNEDYSSAIVFNFEANYHQVIDKRMTSAAAMISGKEVINDSSVITAESNYKGPEETKSRKPKKCSHKLKEAQENKEKANQLPPTGYVFVRARRGQAKDSHSLAERERRKKLSEKMKMLQSLVPGCAMMTNKMKILEEVIRYVQHLQHTVEFLSMELAYANQMSHNNGVDLNALMVKPNGRLSVHTNCVSAPPSQYAQESMAIPTAFVDDQINFIQPNHFSLLLHSSASNPMN